ncbi:MAG: dynamin family protein [Phormidesmis sp.]
MNSSSPLPEYRRTTFMLSDWLRRLSVAANELALDEAAISSEDMQRRIEANAFSIAVVGEFKRGKSTLINALLGRAVLPADTLPATATLNRIRYGTKAQATIHYQDGRLEDVPIANLSQYVTKLTPQSAKKAATVREAVIYYPTPYCQNGVDILDTPGLEDEAAMTAITLAALSQVDAAIFVVMAYSPFSQSERAFFSEKLLQQGLESLLVVVTGIDRCQDSESAASVVQRVENQIRSTILQSVAASFGDRSEQYKAYATRLDRLKVIGVSAYQALQAKVTHDSALFARSGFAELEGALKKLLEERGLLLLRTSVKRSLSVSGTVLTAIANRQTDLASQRSVLNNDYEQVAAMLAGDRAAQAALSCHQRTIHTFQERLLFWLGSLNSDLQQSAHEIVRVVSPALLRGMRSQVFERLTRLEKTVSDTLENHSRRWAGKLQIEFRRSLVSIPRLLSPEAEQILQWMNWVGLYGISVGKTIQQQILQTRLAHSLYADYSNAGQLDHRFDPTQMAHFKQKYTAGVEAIIAEAVASRAADCQRLYNQLTVLLADSNPATWQTDVRTQWLFEQRLELTRNETKVDLALQNLQTLKADIEKIQREATVLQTQLADNS